MEKERRVRTETAVQKDQQGLVVKPTLEERQPQEML
jgi:hypothetical protein